MDQRDQLRGSVLRVGGLRQHALDVIVRDHRGYPVGAQQVPVSRAGLVQAHLRDGGRPPVQGTQQHGALRVGRSLFPGQAAHVDHGLHEGVVVGDLEQLPVTQQVGPGVTDVHQRQVRAGDHHGSQGRASHREVVGFLGQAADSLVGRLGGIGQGVQQVAG